MQGANSLSVVQWWVVGGIKFAKIWAVRAADGNEKLAIRRQDDSGFALWDWGCEGLGKGLTRLYGPPGGSNAPPHRQAVPLTTIPLSPSRS